LLSKRFAVDEMAIRSLRVIDTNDGGNQQAIITSY